MSLRLAGAAIFVVAALFARRGGSCTVPFGDALGPGVFPVVGVPAMALAASLVAFPAGGAEWPGRGAGRGRARRWRSCWPTRSC